MLPVITLPQADKDSDLFFLYIAEGNPDQAQLFLACQICAKFGYQLKTGRYFN